MQTRIVTRPAIAAMALVLVGITVPRAGSAQQCRRTCQAGETRDVRGCCVPKATPAPKPVRPAPRPASRREPSPRPARPAPAAEIPAAKPAEPPASKPVLEEPAASQRPRAAQPPGATAPSNLHTERATMKRIEPVVPSHPGTEPVVDAHPVTPKPYPAQHAPGMLAAEKKRESEPRRRWPVWMPWTVVGAGAVMTGVGGLLYTTAASKYDTFDREFDERCGGYSGCSDDEIPSSLADRLDRARSLETTSRVSFIVGGVALATGAVLVFLNQSIDPTRERATAQRFLLPTLAPGAAGITAGMSF